MFARFLDRDKKRTGESAKKAAADTERARKFVQDPSNFIDATDTQVFGLAQHAACNAFGGDVTIVGNIERGHITGQQKMFNADGTSRTETFDN